MRSRDFRATGDLNPHLRNALFPGLAANNSFGFCRKAEAVELQQSSRFSTVVVDERGESRSEDKAMGILEMKPKIKRMVLLT